MQKAVVYVALAGLANAYGTVVSLVRAASQKAQLVPNEEVQDIECEASVADEMWSFIQKNKSTVDQRH